MITSFIEYGYLPWNMVIFVTGTMASDKQKSIVFFLVKCQRTKLICT